VVLWVAFCLRTGGVIVIEPDASVVVSVSVGETPKMEQDTTREPNTTAQTRVIFLRIAFFIRRLLSFTPPDFREFHTCLGM
jgi:hypothetical protein